MRLLISSLLVLALSPIFGSQKTYVIHGYASPMMVMRKIDKCLIKEHFVIENYGYKSMSEDLDSIGKQLYIKIIGSGVDTVSFVTHSMGALVVRSMLQYSLKDKNFPVIFRIVMIAPPNSGAEIADFYSSFEILKKLLGPNVRYMKTDSGSYANKLPKPYHSEVGIIVGIRGKKHGYNPFIRGDNDGLLTPQRTTLGIEKDIAFIKNEHAALTRKSVVSKLTVEFLKYGTFITKDKK